MKRFIKIALEIKMRTCLIFTGITLVAMACQLIGLTDRVDVLFLWQALLLGFLFALLQYVLVSGGWEAGDTWGGWLSSAARFWRCWRRERGCSAGWTPPGRSSGRSC